MEMFSEHNRILIVSWQNFEIVILSLTVRTLLC